MGKSLLPLSIVKKHKYENELKITNLPKELANMPTCLVCRKDNIPKIESYLKGLLIFSNKVDDSIQPLESKLENFEDDSLLVDKVFNRIGIDKNNLDNIVSTTLDYIRLKRNRLIHSNAENISKSLNTIIKNQGVDLNNHWNSKLPSKLQSLDFSEKENANELSFNIIIDIINIFRGISSEIDKIVINKLTTIRIVEKIIIPAFKDMQGKKINGFKSQRLENKFKRYCDSEFAFAASVVALLVQKLLVNGKSLKTSDFRKKRLLRLEFYSMAVLILAAYSMITDKTYWIALLLLYAVVVIFLSYRE